MGSLAERGLRRMVRNSVGGGLGRNPLGTTLCAVGHQCRLSGGCRSDRVEDLPAGVKHPWKPEGLALLKALRGRVSSTWTVIVLADRGVYAKWLFKAINGLGWHPMLRVTIGGSFRPEGWYHWVPFRQLVAIVGQRRQGRGTAFTQTKTRLNGTLLGCWEAGHDQPWLIMTDVPPQAADAGWYGLRAGIEQGFKRIKSGGWQWQYTRMTDPARAERLWLAIAIATWWLLSVGGEAQAAIPTTTFPSVPSPPRPQGRCGRLVSIFRQGGSLLMAALFNHHRLPLGHGHPEPWPTWPIAPNNPLSAVSVGGLSKKPTLVRPGGGRDVNLTVNDVYHD